MRESTDRTLLGAASQGALGNNHRIAEAQHEEQVDQEEDTAAVFCGEIGKTPDITQTDGGAGRRKNETETGGKTTPLTF